MSKSRIYLLMQKSKMHAYLPLLQQKTPRMPQACSTMWIHRKQTLLLLLLAAAAAEACCSSSKGGAALYRQQQTAGEHYCFLWEEVGFRV